MGSSPYKGDGIFEKELEDELMKFTKKDEQYKLDAISNEQTGEIPRNTDTEINIVECAKSSSIKLFEGKCQDTTESSSSFDNSDCGIENFDFRRDSEARSDFCDDATSALQFGERFMMRKKVTTHWRSFIQPLMWRCKWIELQVNKLQSQAQRYDQELEVQNKQKQTNLENSTLDHGVKSFPYSCTNARSDILRRKKRRKTEETTDVAAYISCHNLFSYYDKKKSSSECAFMSNMSKKAAMHEVNTDGGFCSNDDLVSFEPGDNSFEHLLWKIHYLQSQVGKLKDRADRVMAENADRLSSTDILNLPMPHNAPTPNCGDGMPVGSYIASQLISEYNLGDVRVTGTAATSRGDVAGTNGRLTDACFANSYENVEDGVLIDNVRVKEELNSFEEMRIPPGERSLVLDDGSRKAVKEDISNSEEVEVHPIESPLVLKEGPSTSNPSVPTEPDVPTDNQPPPKTRSLAKITAPKSKKKGGRRKGANRWSRRPKGDHLC